MAPLRPLGGTSRLRARPGPGVLTGMPERSVTAIKHVAYEDLGSFEKVLKDAGYSVRYLHAGIDDVTAAGALETDLLVVLGGPIGANDVHDYPFLRDEIELLQDRIRAERPTLGICLGAQLMARAMGAEVRPAPAKEIGWAPVTLTAAGRASCLEPLGPLPLLHWHGDMFDIPAGAERLAATPVCPNQAFSVGATQLALQFHPEVTAGGMERWYIGHAHELAAAGIEISRLRSDSRRHGPALETRGAQMLRSWLAQAHRGQTRSACSAG